MDTSIARIRLCGIQARGYKPCRLTTEGFLNGTASGEKRVFDSSGEPTDCGGEGLAVTLFRFDSSGGGDGGVYSWRKIHPSRYSRR